MNRVVLIIFISLFVHPLMAQQERKFIREGNDLFNKQDFEKAEVEYRKALDKEMDSYAAAFNLGDAMYKQKKYEEALQQFSALAKEEVNKERLGELYHNIGNTLLAMNKVDESIEAYKQSLRNKPTSQETKYNLEFARKQKQQQQQQQQQDQNQQNQDQNKDQQNKDQQNQNKDQQNQDQKKQDQQNKDQQGKDQQNQDQQQKQNEQNQDKKTQNQQGEQQQEEGKISKDAAERLLEALEADEKKTQEKVQKEKVQALKAKRMKIEKNW